MTRHFQVKIDVDSVLTQLVNQIVQSFELAGVQVLGIVRKKRGIEDAGWAAKKIHVMETNHVDAQFREAPREFVGNLPVRVFSAAERFVGTGRKVGVENEVDSPEAGAFSGVLEVEVSVAACSDKTPRVNYFGRALFGEINKEV